MNLLDALVVGAGPVGLAFAIEASRRGLKIQIVDKAKEGTKQSNALAINSRTLELLEACGIAQKLVKEGNILRQIQVLDTQLNQIVVVDLKYSPSEYKFNLVLPQYKTEAILKDYLKSQFDIDVQQEVELVNTQEVNEADNNKGGYVRSIVKDSNGVEKEIHSKYLVGADGCRSMIRKGLGILFEGFQITQQLYIMEAMMDVPKMFEGRLSVFRTHQNIILITIPMGGGQYRMACQGHDPLKILPDFIKIKQITWTTQIQSQVRKAQTFMKGHIILAGDAAHCHSPAGGRGMNLGIEDACVLAALMQQNKLEMYNDSRQPVVQGVLKQSTNYLKVYQQIGLLNQVFWILVGYFLYWIPSLQTSFLRSACGLSSPKLHDILN